MQQPAGPVVLAEDVRDALQGERYLPVAITVINQQIPKIQKLHKFRNFRNTVPWQYGSEGREAVNASWFVQSWINKTFVHGIRSI